MCLFLSCAREKQALSNKELTQAIENTDFLGLVDDSFTDKSELTQEGIFNLYASTPALQEKIAGLNNGLGFIEITLADFEAFVEDYFGDYQLDPQGLEESLKGRLYYEEKYQIIYLSGVNGGVSWPDFVDSETEIEEISKEEDILTVKARRHYYPSPESKDSQQVTLKLKVKDQD